MKIAYLANSRFPSERAHAVQMVHMCEAFSQIGHQVTFFVTDRHTSVEESPHQYYKLPLNFDLERVHVSDIAAKGRFFFMIASLVFAINVFRQLSTAQFDAIYSRHDWVLFFLSLFSSKLLLVYESHEAKYTANVRWLIRKKCKLVVISEGIRDAYIKHGVASDNILVAHDAIDESFFESHISREEARRRLGIATPKPVAMYIGGFETWKGTDTFFKAAEQLPAVQFVAIGGNLGEVEALKKIHPQVLFLGSRPYNELPFNQRAADVLVIPNTAKTKLSSEYTSPLKLFAHITSNVPVVASNIPSITNVLSESEAWLFEADNYNSLAETIDAALHDEILAKQKVESAYNLSKKYTWNKRAKMIVDFITQNQ